MKMPTDLNPEREHEPRTGGAAIDSFDDLFGDDAGDNNGELVSESTREADGEPAGQSNEPSQSPSKTSDDDTTATTWTTTWSPPEKDLEREREFYLQRKRDAEKRFDAERRYCEAGLAVIDLSEQLAAAVEELQEAREEIEAEQHRPPQAKPASPTRTSTVASWRSTPTTSLDLSHVKRFGDKRRQEFYRVCPTMGELHDLINNGEGLSSINGIGDELADALADSFLAWMEANGVVPKVTDSGDKTMAE